MPVTHVEPDHRVEVAGRSDSLIGAEGPWQGRSVLDIGHVLLGYVDDNVMSKFKVPINHAG